MSGAIPFDTLFTAAAWVGALSILLASGLSFVLTNRVSGSIRALCATADTVGHGDLNPRSHISSRSAAEIKELAKAFNGMLDRLSGALEQSHLDTAELRAQIEEAELLQAQFIQAQKMEAIGRVAGGVAHDFNNLLTVIIGNCQLAMADTPKDDPRYHDLEQVMKGGERAAELTRQLLFFSRNQSLELQILQLNDTVVHIDPMLRRLSGEQVRLTTHLAPDLYRIRAEAGRMEQIIMNLVVNACDAMDNDGDLNIVTENIVICSLPEARQLGINPGEYAVLHVTDTGCGMDKETQARIFEPFFKTQKNGKGEGLGLSNVYGMLQHMGASISVSSSLGQGSEFKLFFKRATSLQEGAAAVDRQEGAITGNEFILIVDDEEYITEVLVKALSEHGYQTASARNGEAAMELIADGHPQIDLLITDIVMPGINGPELSRKMALQRPEMKTIYITGYQNEAAAVADESPQTAAIQKPFSLDELLTRVRETLDNSCILPPPST